jgi:hypothetical protein
MITPKYKEMFKRLIHFIRYMREPAYEDPKAQRWMTLYQQRARLTGQLPDAETLRKTGIPADHPFWKEDNSNPSVGFAANMNTPVTEALAAPSAAGYVIDAHDDFGLAVTHLPIGKTSPRIYFHSGAAYDLDDPPERMPVAEFVWTAARLFRDALLATENAPEEADDDYEESEEDDEPSSKDPANHTIRRVTWSPRLGAWLLITDAQT